MNEKADPPQEKKIIVDEDWKAQVQAEKEAAQKAAAEAEQRKGRRGPLPPPSLTMLVDTLGMQAMMAMGLVPHPDTGTTEVDLEQAKHLIDTVELLLQKTEGNRTPDETAAMEDLLHQLRLGYVTILERARNPKP